MRAVAPMRSPPSGVGSIRSSGKPVDVDHARGPLDVELHQVDQRRAAGEEPHVRALLCRGRRGRGGDRRSRVRGPNESEGLMASAPGVDDSRARRSADLLHRRDDVQVGAAPADVAAHQLLDVRVVGAARLLQERDRRHDLARRAVAALVRVARDERGLHRMQHLRRAEALDGGDLVALVHQREAQARVHPPAVRRARCRRRIGRDRSPSSCR